jgi:hypothetical protein
VSLNSGPSWLACRGQRVVWSRLSATREPGVHSPSMRACQSPSSRISRYAMPMPPMSATSPSLFASTARRRRPRRAASLFGAEFSGARGRKVLSIVVSVSTARPKASYKHRAARRPKRASKQSATSSVLIRGVMSFGEKRPQRDRIGPVAAMGTQELCAKSPPLLGVCGPGRSQRECWHRG